MADVLFSGCTVQSRLPFIEAAFRFIIDKIGMEIDDLHGETCCMEPTGLRAVNGRAWMLVNARHHSIAAGRRIVTLCEGCNLSLSESPESFINDEETKEIMNEMGYDISVSKVSGTLQFLYENIDLIMENATNRIDMKLAMFPGCHCEYVCWKNGESAIQMMQRILEAIGSKPMRAAEDMCCGGTVSMIDNELDRKILEETVNSFKDMDSDAAVTACPFCFMRFDMVAKFKTYHLAEIVAMAMGWEDPSIHHSAR